MMAPVAVLDFSSAKVAGENHFSFRSSKSEHLKIVTVKEHDVLQCDSFDSALSVEICDYFHI